MVNQCFEKGQTRSTKGCLVGHRPVRIAALFYRAQSSRSVGSGRSQVWTYFPKVYSSYTGISDHTMIPSLVSLSIIASLCGIVGRPNEIAAQLFGPPKECFRILVAKCASSSKRCFSSCNTKHHEGKIGLPLRTISVPLASMLGIQSVFTLSVSASTTTS